MSWQENYLRLVSWQNNDNNNVKFQGDTSKNKKYQSMRFCTEALTFLYSIIKCCQMLLNFCFYLFYCNQKEKDQRRKINSKQKYLCVKSVLLLFLFTKN